MPTKNINPSKDLLTTTSHTWANNPKLLQVLNQIDFSNIKDLVKEKTSDQEVSAEDLSLIEAYHFDPSLPKSDAYFSNLFSLLDASMLTTLFEQANHHFNRAEIQFVLDSWTEKEQRFMQLKRERDEAIRAKEKAEELSLKMSQQIQFFKKEFQNQAKRDLHFTSINYKPVIHLLLVGIDDYPDIKDLMGCVKDVQTFATIFKTQEGKLYKKVNAHLLLNKEATIPNIIKKTEEIIEEANPLDYIYIFFSGHAVLQDLDEDGDKDGYYIAYPEQGKTIHEGKLLSGLQGNTICSLLMQSQSTVLLFCDFCYGGGFIQPLIDANKSSDIEHNVFAMAATHADEFATEDDNGGIFTQAVKRCFETEEADLDGNGVVYLDELYQYTFNEVTEKSETQNPVICVPSNMVNIPIFQLGDKFALPIKEFALTGHIEDDHVIECIFKSMLTPEEYKSFDAKSFEEIMAL